MGRTIEAGHLYVNSVPVKETAEQRSYLPCTVFTMQKLLPDAQVIPCDTVDGTASIENSEYKQIVIDAKTHEDLAIIAKVINHIGNKIIPVGSAGLAQKLKNIQNKPRPKREITLGRTLIVVITSIHNSSQLQVDEYVSTLGGKSIVFHPSPSQLMNYSQSEHSLKLQLNALIRFSKDNVIIRTSQQKVVNAKSANITETAKRNFSTLS